MQDIIAGPDRFIRIGTTVAVLLVAIIAAVVSFIHIEALALTHGQTALAAYLLPVSIDGAVAASSLVMLRSARLDLATPWLARVMLGLSVAATLAANVAYGARFGVTGALLSGWPAVAFIGSAELSIGMVRRARQGVPAHEAPAVAVADSPEVADTEQSCSNPVAISAPESVPEAVAEPAHQADVDRTYELAEASADCPTVEQIIVPDPVKPLPSLASKRTRKRVPVTPAERAQARYGEHILSGAPVPSLRVLMSELSLGQPKARQARAHLESLAVNGSNHV